MVRLLLLPAPQLVLQVQQHAAVLLPLMQLQQHRCCNISPYVWLLLLLLGCPLQATHNSTQLSYIAQANTHTHTSPQTKLLLHMPLLCLMPQLISMPASCFETPP